MHSAGAALDKSGFRLRGTAMSRVDGFSDVVFGFALALLVVSLDVPKNYGELRESLRGFLPFAVCFLFLMLVWRAHFRFFRRYGLHDTTTIALNATLLFVVLFYVYPLKFLFSFLFLQLFFGGPATYLSNWRELRELMVLFGVGFAAIYALIAAMNWNAWRQREELELNDLEATLTRKYVWTYSGVALIGLLSCGVAMVLPPVYSGLAGLTFWLIAVYHRVLNAKWKRKLERARDAAQMTGKAHPV